MDPVFYTNINRLEEELEQLASTKQYIRIGSGELSDSLAYDSVTAYSLKILKIMSDFREVVFEFKTKSNQVNHLLKYASAPANIVVSWSLNPQAIITAEEHRTANLDHRLQALEQIQAKGYKIGIHFDPIIFFPDWKDLYLGFIKQLSGIIRANRIAWWSLGVLRFPIGLRDHILNLRDSQLFTGELIRGHDDKYRYFKPLRIEMFQFVKRAVQKYISRDIPLYLCMEDEETWSELLPEFKADPVLINKYLYDSALNTST